MKLLKKLILLQFITLGTYLFSQDKTYLKISKNVYVADLLMEKGAVNSAYFILKKELKNDSYSNFERYQILKLISRGFLKELDYSHYDEYNRKAYELVKVEAPIFKAQYMIERAYFFHHLTFADSVLYYAFHAKQIFDKNKNDWCKIDVPFFYRIYGISRMYSMNKLRNTTLGKYKIPYNWVQMFKYFDTSMLVQKKFPYKHQSDIALAYRGFANRYLDLISGYNYPTKQTPYPISALGWYSFYKSKYYYHKAIENLDKSNSTDIIPNIALLGLANMCVGNPMKARWFFDRMHENYFKNKNWKVLSSIDECLTALNYERINDFHLPYDAKRNKKAIVRLEAIIPQWIDFLKSKNKFSYDIYNYSPFNQLYCYYLRAYFHSHKYQDLKRATEYLLTEKNHFKFLNKISDFEKYKCLLAKKESETISKKYKKLVSACLPKMLMNSIGKTENIFPISSIHNGLKKNQILLLKYKTPSFLNNYKIAITNKRIYCVESSAYSNLDIDIFQNYNFYKFKREAYNGYSKMLKPLLTLLPNTKTIFTMYDDNTKYTLLTTSKKGNTYSDLDYVLKSVNFVSVYNTESYFNKKKIKVTPNLTLIKLKTALKNRLVFMENFKPVNPVFKIKISNNIDTNFVDFFKKKGVYHVIGHGDQRSIDSLGLLHMNKWVISDAIKTTKIENFQLNKKLKADLIILNNCYSGIGDPIVILYDKGLYLQLMYNGASTLIATNDRVDDYVSSQIFKYYYDFISKGYMFDVALSMAQRKFLIKNKNQYANPAFWYPYFVISSRKVFIS